MTTPSDPVLEAYWKKVLDEWPDDARHKTFVAYCAQTAQLPEAALRYRAIAEPKDEPDLEAKPEAAEDGEPAVDAEAERRADAKRRLDSVAAAAVLMLASEPRTEPIDGKRLGRKLGLGFLVVVFAVLAYLLFVVYGAR
jgi:hypothetical protein